MSPLTVCGWMLKTALTFEKPVGFSTRAERKKNKFSDTFSLVGARKGRRKTWS